MPPAKGARFMSLSFRGVLRDGNFKWDARSHYDLRSAVIFQFIVPAPRHFSSNEEACDFAAHNIRNLNWCTPGPLAFWVFDLNALQKQHPGTFPDWLRGNPTTAATARPVALKPPENGMLPTLDALEITCQFVEHTFPPELTGIIETANRPPDIQESLS